MRYTASEINIEEFAASRKAAKEKERSSSPSSRSGSPSGKRKIRKTTGEGGEIVLDELELIGYQVGILNYFRGRGKVL